MFVCVYCVVVVFGCGGGLIWLFVIVFLAVGCVGCCVCLLTLDFVVILVAIGGWWCCLRITC